MSVPKSQVSMDHIVGVIESLARKGIRIWSENGLLHYKAPKGILAQKEIVQIRQHRDQLVSLLEGDFAGEIAEPGPHSGPRLNQAPLTFTQLARWNLYQLGTRPNSSFVPSVLRLLGRLNIDALRRSVTELVRRHDALRTRITIRDGSPLQTIAASGNLELEVDDLTLLDGACREAELRHRIEKLVYEPVDVATGPLFRARLLILGDAEHALLLSMHHMISDGSSMRVLLDELFTAYSQLTTVGELSLPAVALQFTDYADWQRKTHKSWIRRHGPYWEERTKGFQRVRFPSDRKLPIENCSDWGSASFQLDPNLKIQLQEWCRHKRTTLVMSVFTAYIALVLRWCNTTEAVFLCETDGRPSEALQKAIGNFAFPLYLPIKVFPNDTFADLLQQVTDEYCRAYEHADFCYMEAQVPMPQLARNTVFNWVGRDLGLDVVDSCTNIGSQKKA